METKFDKLYQQLNIDSKNNKYFELDITKSENSITIADKKSNKELITITKDLNDKLEVVVLMLKNEELQPDKFCEFQFYIECENELYKIIQNKDSDILFEEKYNLTLNDVSDYLLNVITERYYLI